MIAKLCGVRTRADRAGDANCMGRRYTPRIEDDWHAHDAPRKVHAMREKVSVRVGTVAKSRTEAAHTARETTMSYLAQRRHGGCWLSRVRKSRRT
jgi:hypothetical protein